MAVCLVVSILSASLGLHHLAASVPAVVPLMYLNPLAVIAGILARFADKGCVILVSGLIGRNSRRRRSASPSD